MRKQERFLPPKIGRFNYWKWFRPGAVETVNPLKQHIKRQFTFILTASSKVWDKEVRPWLHKKLSDIPDRRFLALEVYAFDDKEWAQDKDAWKVYRQLSIRQQTRILQLSKQKWHYRSQWTWDTLTKTIARDQSRFESFLETPDTANLVGTDRRIYETHHKQANMILDFVKDISSQNERRQAKKATLHWFQHTLRNMREYRNNRPLVPWSPKCAATCYRIQKKLSFQ